MNLGHSNDSEGLGDLRGLTKSRAILIQSERLQT